MDTSILFLAANFNSTFGPHGEVSFRGANGVGRMENAMRTLTDRARALIAIFLVAALGMPSVASAQTPATPSTAKPAVVPLLFVQNSRGVVVDKEKSTLTLKGVSPTTLFFSDRPVRIAGHFHTRDEFLPLWSEGKDSFLKDPPNATLSVFEAGQEDLVDVVVKLSNPQLKGEDLTYDITVIDGKLPSVGGPSSLFIDIIGLPWTPLSYAGVARRWTRRAVFFGAAATSAAAATAIAAHPVPTTVNVTETVVPPPAPAPAPAGQSTAVARLKELKSLLNQGLITESQYQAESQKILNQLVQ